MCGRWYIDLMSDAELTEYYENVKFKDNIKVKGEVFPSDHVIALAKSKSNKELPFNMKWGYSLNKKLVFNARSETVFSKVLFSNDIKSHRCVVPINYYYEWEKETKEKYEIHNGVNKVMYLLGIYRLENDETVVTILTKNASDSMASLHDRMPLVINKDQISDWLDSKCDINLLINNTINDLDFYKYKEEVEI